MIVEEAEQKAGGGYGGRPWWQWLVVYATVGIVIYAGVYYFWMQKKDGTYMNKAEPTGAMVKKEVAVVLTSQNNSEEEGTATLVEEEGKVRVNLNLSGAPEEVKQPAHIHAGTCAQLGTVKYGLEVVVDGESETVLDLSLEQLKGMVPWAVNVHKSESEAGVYVACGDVSF